MVICVYIEVFACRIAEPLNHFRLVSSRESRPGVCAAGGDSGVCGLAWTSLEEWEGHEQCGGVVDLNHPLATARELFEVGEVDGRTHHHVKVGRVVSFNCFMKADMIS